MTTPPKATKFRIRRTTDGAAATVRKVARQDSENAADEDLPFAPGPNDHGFGEGSYLPDPPADAPVPNLAEALAAVRAEGLSGRQLRTARRVALKHGITASDDAEAVLLLRRKGIDPFSLASSGLGVIRSDDEPSVHLPQTVRASQSMPAAQTYGEAQRAQEIIRIQQDIIRRRRNFMMLLARLSVFVFLPSIVAGIYYFFIATPMYATRSEFVIQQADSQMGGLGSLFRGTQFATSQGLITVQAYLQSRDAMLRLDKDLGFKSTFSQPDIDVVQRLDPNATNEEAYRLYRRMVQIGYDPTEGIVKMEVIAPTPAISENFSKALLNYAEEQVDHLTQRLREDQMKGARESFADAERKASAAQSTILDLQERLGVLDPRTEGTAVFSQITTFEIELQQKRLELQQLEDNAQPNAARVAGAKGDIERLEKTIAELRDPLTKSGNGTASLAQVTGQLRVAEGELETRQAMLGAAMQQLETARIEANRQVRYISLGVSPVAPDEATYPRAFENTLLALLIFGGIYLMLSLTAAILREQVTS